MYWKSFQTGMLNILFLFISCIDSLLSLKIKRSCKSSNMTSTKVQDE